MSIEQVVQSKYGAVANSGRSSNQDGVRAIAEAFGYSADQLAEIPAEANMGLSCGNPTAFASLKPGEVVVDLGSGGGLDVFLAAKTVGPEGKAIGIDMTPEMIALAEANQAKSGATNVEFHLATIDKLPLPDQSVDCVISNCVINLAADKQAVFREVARVLKPTGRLAVSDIALKAPLPEELSKSWAAYVGCVAGAISIDAYRDGLLAAGFTHVEVVDTQADLNTYAKADKQQSSSCCSPSDDASQCCLPITDDADAEAFRDQLFDLMKRYNINDYAASVKVYAVKTADQPAPTAQPVGSK